MYNYDIDFINPRPGFQREKSFEMFIVNANMDFFFKKKT